MGSPAQRREWVILILGKNRTHLLLGVQIKWKHYGVDREFTSTTSKRGRISRNRKEHRTAETEWQQKYVHMHTHYKCPPLPPYANRNSFSFTIFLYFVYYFISCSYYLSFIIHAILTKIPADKCVKQQRITAFFWII